MKRSDVTTEAKTQYEKDLVRKRLKNVNYQFLKKALPSIREVKCIDIIEGCRDMFVNRYPLPRKKRGQRDKYKQERQKYEKNMENWNKHWANKNESKITDSNAFIKVVEGFAIWGIKITNLEDAENTVTDPADAENIVTDSADAERGETKNGSVDSNESTTSSKGLRINSSPSTDQKVTSPQTSPKTARIEKKKKKKKIKPLKSNLKSKSAPPISQTAISQTAISQTALNIFRKYPHLKF